jgi:DNA glycosylase AlkZ-like
VWWSGLTVRDARTGIEMNASDLREERFEDRTYWFVPSRAAAPRGSPFAHLLPNYDEYLIAYKDRGPVAGTSQRDGRSPRGSDVFTHGLLIDGRLAGSWTKTSGRDGIRIEVAPYRRPTAADRRALAAAAGRYSRFLGLAVEVDVSTSSARRVPTSG